MRPMVSVCPRHTHRSLIPGTGSSPTATSSAESSSVCCAVICFDSPVELFPPPPRMEYLPCILMELNRNEYQLEMNRRDGIAAGGETPDRESFDRVADDFLAYLEERESGEATDELLNIPGFKESLEQAEQEIAAGQLTPANKLRRKS